MILPVGVVKAAGFFIPQTQVISLPYLPELICLGSGVFFRGVRWRIVANARRLSRRLTGVNYLFGSF
jgi:hypothetical protein